MQAPQPASSFRSWPWPTPDRKTSGVESRGHRAQRGEPRVAGLTARRSGATSRGCGSNWIRLDLVAEVVVERVRAILVGYQARHASGAFFDRSEALIGDSELFAGFEDLLGGLSPFAGLCP